MARQPFARYVNPLADEDSDGDPSRIRRVRAVPAGPSKRGFALPDSPQASPGLLRKRLIRLNVTGIRFFRIALLYFFGDQFIRLLFRGGGGIKGLGLRLPLGALSLPKFTVKPFSLTSIRPKFV